MTEEEQRQYNEAKKFIHAHPEYMATNENNIALLNWMDHRGMEATFENFCKAYEAISLPEPTVLTPKEFFAKVQPGSASPPGFKPLLSVPLPTGISGPDIQMVKTWGAIAGLDVVDFIKNYNEAFNVGGTAWEPQLLWPDTPPKVPKKDVAPTPAPCYSGEVIELRSGRRIKDDD